MLLCRLFMLKTQDYSGFLVKLLLKIYVIAMIDEALLYETGN